MTEIVKPIFPADFPLEFVRGRSRCIYCLDHKAFESADYADYLRHYSYIKVLKKVKRRGYHLKRVPIVDETPSRAKRNYGNVIYPSAYPGSTDGQELKWLLPYLLQLKNILNVRCVVWKNDTGEG